MRSFYIITILLGLALLQGCSSSSTHNPWAKNKESTTNRRAPEANPKVAVANQDAGNGQNNVGSTSSKNSNKSNQAYSRYMANQPETLQEFDKKRKRYPSLNPSELNLAMDNSAKIEVTSKSNLKEVIDYNKKMNKASKAKATHSEESTTHKKEHIKHKHKKQHHKKHEYIAKEDKVAKKEDLSKSMANGNVVSTTVKSKATQEDSKVVAVPKVTSNAAPVAAVVVPKATQEDSKVVAAPKVTSNAAPVAVVAVPKTTQEDSKVVVAPKVTSNAAPAAAVAVPKTTQEDSKVVAAPKVTSNAAPAAAVVVPKATQNDTNTKTIASNTATTSSQPAPVNDDLKNVSTVSKDSVEENKVTTQTTKETSSSVSNKIDFNKMSQTDIENYLKKKFKNDPNKGYIDNLNDTENNSQSDAAASNISANSSSTGVSKILTTKSSSKLGRINSLLIECYYSVKNKALAMIYNYD